MSARRSTMGSRRCSRKEHKGKIHQLERCSPQREEEVDLAAHRLLVLLANAGGRFTAMTFDTSADIVRILMASGDSHCPLQEKEGACIVEGDGN